MLKLLCVPVLLACSAALAAGAGNGAVFSTQHDLLVRAIREGQAVGEVQGDMAAHFTQRTRSNGLLTARARVIAELPRSDCKRLQVDYTKHDVMTTIGPRPLEVQLKLNYCLDGKPPIQSVRKDSQ